MGFWGGAMMVIVLVEEVVRWCVRRLVMSCVIISV